MQSVLPKLILLFSVLFCLIFFPVRGRSIFKNENQKFSLDTKANGSYFIEEDVADKRNIEHVFRKNVKLGQNDYSLISHARPGAIWYNKRWLYGRELTDLLKNTMPQGTTRLLLWGCNFGAGKVGREAVKRLAQELGVTIGASDNVTGKHGDWVLEIGRADLSEELASYRYDLQCDPLCIINEKAVGSFADFENGSFITDRLGNTRALAGAGVGNYSVLTYGATSGVDADVTINVPWGNASIKPSNPGSKYLGGNDVTGGESWVRTNPFVSTNPYLDFTGATQFCFDYFDASTDGQDRSTGFDVTIYHGGTPNNHVYNINLTKASGDVTNAGGVTYSPSTQSAWATLNGVEPPTNPTTTEWSVKPRWVRFCIPLSGFNLAQVRGIQIHTEGINNGVSEQEKWGLDNVAFSTPCNNPCSMPVTLVSFNARQASEGILLEWRTADERDFDRFEIEQSITPEKGFTTIATIKGGQSEYSHLDVKGNGLSYYRLKMIDTDGTFRYSRIVAITSWNGVELHRVYPNPSRSRSVFLNSVAPVESYAVTSVTGKSIPVKMVGLGGQYRFDLPADALPGTYILTYKAAGMTTNQQFVINN